MNFRDLLNVSGGNMGSALNVIKTILTDSSKGQNTASTSSFQTRPNQGVEELALLFETLYNLLLEKGVFTGDEFVKKFDSLDMLDGVKDGKNKK